MPRHMFVTLWEEEGTNGPGNTWLDRYGLQEVHGGRIRVVIQRESHPDPGPSFIVYRSKASKVPARLLDAMNEALGESEHVLDDFDLLRMIACVCEEDAQLGVALLREQLRRMKGEWSPLVGRRPAGVPPYRSKFGAL